ncbi:MAG: hypothetical protein R3B40_06820 [Polyangiales bacterium]|nr:hypothetical protein [Myxococcales bacterium]MCB9657643.1 hypothetical protein [Sandaracinaceae bacterium]
MTVAGSAAAPQNDLPPREALERVEAHATSAQYVRTGPAVHNANMPQNGLVAYALDADAGQCFLAVAVSPPGTDLNMVVIDPRGAAVAHNVQPDAHPWVELCAATRGRHVVRLQMVRGSGEYYYAVYARQGSQQADIAGLYGDAAATQVQAATLDADTQGRVSALDQRLRAQRYQNVSAAQGVQLATREQRDYPLNLQGGYCYAFATFGGPGTSDTDIFILDGNEQNLAADQATARDAMVEFCPPLPGAYTLRARLYNGAGPVFVAAWARPEAGASSVPPPSATTVVGTSTAAVSLDDSYRRLDADMIARGYEHYGEPASGELTQGQTQDFGISLEGGKCYAILAVGDTGVRDLDLAVLDASGQAIDRDVEADARPVVRVCPERSGESRIQVRMASGGGAFRYVAYRWPRGTRGPFNLNGLIYVRLAEVTALLSVDGYEPSVDFMPDRGRLRSTGATARHSVQLPAGRCLSVLTVGGDGVHDLDATISLGGSQLSRDTSHNAFPDIRFCTERAGNYTLEITARAGAGEYFYQVFEQSR